MTSIDPHFSFQTLRHAAENKHFAGWNKVLKSMWRHIRQTFHVIITLTTILVSSPHERVFRKIKKCPVIFDLVYTALPNYRRVTRISANTFGWIFKSFHEVNQKFRRFFFLLFCFIFLHTEKETSGCLFATSLCFLLYICYQAPRCPRPPVVKNNITPPY